MAVPATASRPPRHGDRTTRVRGIGWEHLHVAVDDCTRLAYAEVLAGGETADATTAFLRRAADWFAARGVIIERVLTDNGPGYRSFAFADLCDELDIGHRFTRPYRPQTNGKAERFIRMITNGWAYAITFPTSAARTRALPAWLHYCNHHPQPSDTRTASTRAEQPHGQLQLGLCAEIKTGRQSRGSSLIRQIVKDRRLDDVLNFPCFWVFMPNGRGTMGPSGPLLDELVDGNPPIRIEFWLPRG